jgi:ubiquitin conjugation factor E4 B
MTEDAMVLSTLASLDENETSWDWLIACWRRCRQEVPKAKKVSRVPVEHGIEPYRPTNATLRSFSSQGLGSYVPQGVSALEEMSALIVSYAGLLLTTPDMFPRHTKGDEALSPLVLVPSILNIGGGAASQSAVSSSSASWATLDQHEMPTFLTELAKRFDGDGLEDILGPAVSEVTRKIRDGARQDPGSSSGAAAGPSNGGNAALQAAAQAGDIQAVLAQLLGGGGQGRPQAAGNAAGAAAAGLDPFGRASGAGTANQGMHLGGFEWRGYVAPVVELTDNKQIAACLVNLAEFDPAGATAPRLELDSLFGPLLRLSTFTDSSARLTEEYFSNPTARSKGEMDSNTNSLRQTLDIIHGFHFRLFNSLVRSSPASREKVLQYWAHVADLNRKRGAMRVKQDQVSTDGFTVNIWETLQRFAEPFMDAGYTKIDRIDPEYLRRQKRYDASTLTRLNASEPEAQQWVDSAPEASAPANFITEVFFLLARMTNLGPGKAIRSYNEKEEDSRRLSKRIKETEDSRAIWGATPQAAQYEAYIKRGNAEVEKLKAECLASVAQLLSPGFVDRLIHSTSFTMTWLVRLADTRGLHPKELVQLPLAQEVPENFKMLPEHIFEDVCDILLFLARHKPDSLPEAVKKDFVTFTVTFLSSGWFIKNPFLKAKLAEIMWWNVIPFGYSQTGILGDVINFHPLALQHLVPALMSFWVEAESTGSHTQFYDKFNIRFHLSQIFKVIWSNPEHMSRIHQESKGNSEKFVVFINRLMNDVTFLLDDALEKLAELHSKQQQMDDSATWNERSAEERQEIESHTTSIQGQIRSMLSFGNEFLRLLIDFTAQTKDAFMTPEIVSRLAAMLDYNLDLMVGPRCTELKIKDPKKVGFEPRHLLRQILSVYLNLSSRSEFVKAIADDGRSYRKATFDKACGVAARHGLKSPSEIEELQRLVTQVERVIQEDKEEEEDLGEVPDEYSDPLMATLMRNPVILPSSKAIVDLSTIKSHLLSDSSDPFNRAPLRIEDCKPATELKEEIENWIKERKRSK